MEQALRAHMTQTIALMGSLSVFWEDVIKRTAIEITAKLVAELLEKNVDDGTQVQDTCHELKRFKASTGWYYGFLKRNNMKSSRSMMDMGLLWADNIKAEQVRLQKLLCSWHVHNIANTDEVGVLFRSFPSSTGYPRDRLKASQRMNDRLTAVLNVFGNSDKFYFVVIGKFRRTKSLPRGFEPSELGIYYYAQHKS